MGAVLYSTKWVTYSALPQATTQNTTTKHNNQHEPPTPFPSAALALSLHGNIFHGPNSWRHCSLWVLWWCNASGVLLPLFYPLVGVPKHKPSKNRERGWVSALGGHLLVRQHNNQPKVGVHGRGDIVEGTQPGWNMWGRHRTIV